MLNNSSWRSRFRRSNTWWSSSGRRNSLNRGSGRRNTLRSSSGRHNFWRSNPRRGSPGDHQRCWFWFLSRRGWPNKYVLLVYFPEDFLNTARLPEEGNEWFRLSMPQYSSPLLLFLGTFLLRSIYRLLLRTGYENPLDCRKPTSLLPHVSSITFPPWRSYFPSFQTPFRKLNQEKRKQLWKKREMNLKLLISLSL